MPLLSHLSPQSQALCLSGASDLANMDSTQAEYQFPSVQQLLEGHKPPQSPPPPSTEMASSQVQLPPLSEILGDIPRGRGDTASRDQYGTPTSRESHSYIEPQGLGPSLSLQAYRTPAPYHAEHSDVERRSSYASAPVSTNLTPVTGSPGARSVPGLPSRGPGGLPPLYGGGDATSHRNVPSPLHHQAYGQYGNYHHPDYMPQYRQGAPHGVAAPAGMYPVHFDGVDYNNDNKQGKRRRGNLPKQVTDVLRKWFQDHVAHPYPTEEEKQSLMATTGLSMSQISNWFINARRRSLPPNSRAQQNDQEARNIR